jgi:hypothetical protein
MPLPAGQATLYHLDRRILEPLCRRIRPTTRRREKKRTKNDRWIHHLSGPEFAAVARSTGAEVSRAPKRADKIIRKIGPCEAAFREFNPFSYHGLADY